MSKIIKRLQPEVIKRTAARCRERGIVLPTFKQLRNPELIPPAIQRKLKGVGLWDVNPANLFRITWKNDVKTGLYGGVNYVEIPPAITGVKARVIGLVGKYFPTGAHKVGAAFGCLVPRLVSGEFDPEKHKAAWPSTGNYCRGGAFDCAVLDCTAIAILPQGMSRERFEWLKKIGAEIIATPGCESNVKEIYDKCWELKKDPQNVIFNQFEEFGNPIFHYNVTGPAIDEVLKKLGKDLRAAAYISATGSAGTIAAGDYLKKLHPALKIVADRLVQVGRNLPGVDRQVHVDRANVAGAGHQEGRNPAAHQVVLPENPAHGCVRPRPGAQVGGHPFRIQHLRPAEGRFGIAPEAELDSGVDRISIQGPVQPLEQVPVIQGPGLPRLEQGRVEGALRPGARVPPRGAAPPSFPVCPWADRRKNSCPCSRDRSPKPQARWFPVCVSASPQSFKLAMSMTKRYFTSLFSMRS